VPEGPFYRALRTGGAEAPPFQDAE